MLKASVFHRSVVVLYFGIGVCAANTIDKLSLEYQALAKKESSPLKTRKFVRDVARTPSVPASDLMRIENMMTSAVNKAGGAISVYGKDFIAKLESPEFQQFLTSVAYNMLAGAVLTAFASVMSGESLLTIGPAVYSSALSWGVWQIASSGSSKVVGLLPVSKTKKEFASRSVARVASNITAGSPLTSGTGLVIDASMAILAEDPRLKAMGSTLMSAASNWASSLASITSRWFTNQLKAAAAALPSVDMGTIGAAIETSGVR